MSERARGREIKNAQPGMSCRLCVIEGCPNLGFRFFFLPFSLFPSFFFSCHRYFVRFVDVEGKRQVRRTGQSKALALALFFFLGQSRNLAHTHLGIWMCVLKKQEARRDKATRGSVSRAVFPSSLLRNRASRGLHLRTLARWHAGSRGNSVLMAGMLVARAIVSQPPTGMEACGLPKWGQWGHYTHSACTFSKQQVASLRILHSVKCPEKR